MYVTKHKREKRTEEEEKKNMSLPVVTCKCSTRRFLSLVNSCSIPVTFAIAFPSMVNLLKYICVEFSKFSQKKKDKREVINKPLWVSKAHLESKIIFFVLFLPFTSTCKKINIFICWSYIQHIFFYQYLQHQIARQTLIWILKQWWLNVKHTIINLHSTTLKAT